MSLSLLSSRSTILCGHVYSIMLRIYCVDTIKRESLQLIFYFMHTILLHSVIEYGEMTLIMDFLIYGRNCYI